MRTLATIPILLLAVPTRAEPPLLGDIGHGRALFAAYCASCHGTDGRAQGDLPGHPPVRPVSLRSSALLAIRSDDQLMASILHGTPKGMPAYPRFPALDLWDVVAFLRQGELRVTDFFPEAAFFTGKAYPLDDDAKQRIADALGEDPSAAAATLTVLGFYGHSEMGPQAVAQDPVSLDRLKPRDKIGYLVFVDLPKGSGSATYGIALGRDGRILKIASEEGLATPSSDRAYQPFVGLGHKGKDVLLHPKGKRVPPRLEKAFGRAFVRVLEALTMYDKEERDRHWADN